MPFPEEYPAEEVAGKTAEFDIKVSEVREKELPELNDDFASEASEFDTLDELRGHISDQIKQILERQIAERFQEAALDAAVEQATVELPAPVIQARAEETWRRVERQLAQQGMDPENYLQVQGRSRDEMIEQARPDAEEGTEAGGGARGRRRRRGNRDHRRRHARGAADPPGHEDHGHPEPADALAEIRKSGREDLFKSDLRMRRALELIGEGEADPDGAGPGPRGHLDAGEGARGEGRSLDPEVRLVPVRSRARSAAPDR